MQQTRRTLLAAALAAVAGVGVQACSSNPENRRTVGETAGDAAVTAKVKTAIATDVGARTAANVNVTTYNGTVQLTGFLDSQDQANRAAQAARQVEGVKSVKNDIRIKNAS
jgi:hyperosmotically inducible protein